MAAFCAHGAHQTSCVRCIGTQTSTHTHARHRPNAYVPEEELPIEVAVVYRVHVDDMDVLEPREREVLQELAAEPSSTDDEYAALVLEECAANLEPWGWRQNQRAHTPAVQ